MRPGDNLAKLLQSNGLDPVLVHSSDLHIGTRQHGADLRMLHCVVRAAQDIGARILLIAGDLFEHNYIADNALAEVTRLLEAVTMQVVILPGNHDCLAPGSVYWRGTFSGLPNVHVIGVSVEESVIFPELELEVWGKPHLSYSNFSPLGNPHPRATRRLIAIAHGHWVRYSSDRRRSWLIRNEEIAATKADYVALGHWENAQFVGDGSVLACYSGSPAIARTVNVVGFAEDGGLHISRLPVSCNETK